MSYLTAKPPFLQLQGEDDIGTPLVLSGTLTFVCGQFQYMFALAEVNKPVVGLWFPVAL